MSDELHIDIEINQQLVVEAIHFNIDHDKKDFVRKAAKHLARELIERGCLVHKTHYDIKQLAYVSAVTVIAGRQKRRLPA